MNDPPSQLTLTLPHSLEAVTAPPNGAVPACIKAQLGSVAGLQPRLTVLLQLVNERSTLTRNAHTTTLIGSSDRATEWSRTSLYQCAAWKCSRVTTQVNCVI